MPIVFYFLIYVAPLTAGPFNSTQLIGYIYISS